jgi:formylglycine-generating enzyme required for sulfatase activity
MKKVYKQSSSRVQRGGSWGNYASFLRAAPRYGYSPSGQYDDVGARSAKRVGREESI